jgi:signal transduction histidine kinase
MSDTIEDFKNEYVEAIENKHLLLSDIISQSVAVIIQSLQEKKVKLELKIDTKSSFSYDAKLLKQIILIFLNNAKDALIERSIYKPEISFNAHEDENFFFISICDNAGGIPKSIREKMFEKHFTTKHNAEGTGLGLFMCKEHIEKKLHGSLHVNNRANGVCFDIKLPKE